MDNDFRNFFFAVPCVVCKGLDRLTSLISLRKQNFITLFFRYDKSYPETSLNNYVYMQFASFSLW